MDKNLRKIILLLWLAVGSIGLGMALQKYIEFAPTIGWFLGFLFLTAILVFVIRTGFGKKQ